MFNFKDELNRYKPLLELEEMQQDLQSSQLQDLLDILQHIAKNNTHTNNKED